MRFSLRVNNDLGVEEFFAVAVRAERAGFDQLWVSNDLFWQSAPVLLSAAATRTERIMLGCGIFNPYTIHPAEIAMLAASLQDLFWCSVDPDRDAARGALADKIAYYGAAFAPYLLERAGLRVSDFDGAQAAVDQGDHVLARSLVTDSMLRL